MPRRPRRVLEGRLYEVTLKTFQGRYFFVPSKWLNLLLVGVLAYAQRKYGLRVCYVTFLSNHAHLLVRPDSADQLRAFLCLANSQIAREVQKLCGWSGGIFAERATVTEVTSNPVAQIRRLRYLMAQGVKEGLCPSPESWPGVQSAKAWLTGTMRLAGVWVRRSDRYELERRANWRVTAVRRVLTRMQRKATEKRLNLELSPLPCWDQLGREELMQRARQLRRSILRTCSVDGSRFSKGWQKRYTDPELRCYRPDVVPSSAVPRVHAADKAEWIEWVKEWENWFTAYDRASRRLRRGIAKALGEFPEGGFVPAGLGLAGCNGRPPPG